MVRYAARRTPIAHNKKTKSSMAGSRGGLPGGSWFMGDMGLPQSTPHGWDTPWDTRHPPVGACGTMGLCGLWAVAQNTEVLSLIIAMYMLPNTPKLGLSLRLDGRDGISLRVSTFICV